MYIVNLSVNFVLLLIIDRFFIALFSALEQTLRSHVILHECIAFYSVFLNIHRSGECVDILVNECMIMNALNAMPHSMCMYILLVTIKIY